MHSTSSVERSHDEHTDYLTGSTDDSRGCTTPTVGEEESGDSDEKDEEGRDPRGEEGRSA